MTTMTCDLTHPGRTRDRNWPAISGSFALMFGRRIVVSWCDDEPEVWLKAYGWECEDGQYTAHWVRFGGGAGYEDQQSIGWIHGTADEVWAEGERLAAHPLTLVPDARYAIVRLFPERRAHGALEVTSYAGDDVGASRREELGAGLALRCPDYRLGVWYLVDERRCDQILARGTNGECRDAVRRLPYPLMGNPHPFGGASDWPFVRPGY